MECTEKSGHETQTSPQAANGFASSSDALNDLVAKVLAEMERDRPAKKDCSKRECEKGVCKTFLHHSAWSDLEASIYAYLDKNGKTLWGYDWPGGKLNSGCRCV